MNIKAANNFSALLTKSFISIYIISAFTRNNDNDDAMATLVAQYAKRPMIDAKDASGFAKIGCEASSQRAVETLDRRRRRWEELCAGEYKK